MFYGSPTASSEPSGKNAGPNATCSTGIVLARLYPVAESEKLTSCFAPHNREIQRRMRRAEECRNLAWYASCVHRPSAAPMIARPERREPLCETYAAVPFPDASGSRCDAGLAIPSAKTRGLAVTHRIFLLRRKARDLGDGGSSVANLIVSRTAWIVQDLLSLVPDRYIGRQESSRSSD
jgi:hypothetical protein